MLEGEGVVVTARKTIGGTNPADSEPGSIRGDLASAMPDNLVHGSDSTDSPRARSRSGFPMVLSEPEYVDVNRQAWTKANREHTDGRAHGAWAQEEITWGRRGFERRTSTLPDVTDKDVVELGCGTEFPAPG